MKGMYAKATGGSSIRFDDVLDEGYEGNGLKSYRCLKHYILMICYIDLTKEMASKA